MLHRNAVKSNARKNNLTFMFQASSWKGIVCFIHICRVPCHLCEPSTMQENPQSHTCMLGSRRIASDCVSAELCMYHHSQ
mmetsp:Transcript_54478/g.102294  ORF Transcript_54478/g.102294 Transcript_54478/m.102294 type:complete len:80 (-) Transcript_54478:88-327(-)